METRVVIVTAASKGIGKACALKLAEKGYRLSIMSRSDAIKNVFPESPDVITTQGDVGNIQDLRGLVKYTIERFHRIDGVVINTGHTPKGDLISISDEDWNNAFQLAFMNTVRITRLVIPEMQERGSGSLVNISSFAAREPSLQFPTSSVIRSSLGNYARLFAARYGGENLRMNNVLPGFVDSYTVDEDTLKTIPAGRVAKTEEIANLVAFLISDESSYINGQSLVIDGGLSKSI